MDLLSGMLISTVGLGFLSYGKKQGRPPQLLGGILLLVYPYFVSGQLAMWGGAGAIVSLIWFFVKQGM